MNSEDDEELYNAAQWRAQSDRMGEQLDTFLVEENSDVSEEELEREYTTEVQENFDEPGPFSLQNF